MYGKGRVDVHKKRCQKSFVFIFFICTISQGTRGDGFDPKFYLKEMLRRKTIDTANFSAKSVFLLPI